MNKIKLKHIPLLLIGLLATFCLLVLIINLSIFDEKPSEEVIAIMKPHKMPNAQNNAFIMLHGLQADSSKDPIIAGQALMERYQHNLTHLNKDELTDEDYSELIGDLKLDDHWSKNIKHCASRTKANCLAQLKKQPNVWSNKSPRLKLMLSRYEQLLNMTEYQVINNTTLATTLPSFSTPLNLQKILIVEALDIQDYDLFIHHSEKALNFWRMVLVKGDSLLDKMVAVAAIWNTTSYLSDVIFEANLNQQQLTQIQNMLGLLTQTELDISDALTFEAKLMYQQLANLSNDELTSFFGKSYWLFKPLLQINTTNNTHAEKFLSPILKLAKQNSLNLAKQFKTLNNQLEQSTQLSWSPFNLYNLTGKIILTEGGGRALSDYIARVHDLNGYIQLVNLKLKLLNQPKSQWQQIINQSEFKNPYTLKPFEFDQTAMQLGFECLDKGSSCVIKL